MKKLYVVLFVLDCLQINAQSPKQILIETKNTALVLTVGNNKRVTQSYLGRKLPLPEYTSLQGGSEVYLTAGMENQFEPAIRMVHADGNPSLELKYVSHNYNKKDYGSDIAITLRA